MTTEIFSPMPNEELMKKYSESKFADLVHDFEVLLRYVHENKIKLTPQQQFIPLHHVRSIMEKFRIKEKHEEVFGDKIHRKREESEYRRFYFLDVLALSGDFLKVTRKNELSKGSAWKKFFETHARSRPSLLLMSFIKDFNFDAWFMRGDDFGLQLENNREHIWYLMSAWVQEKSITDWKTWARFVIKSFELHWNAPDQTHAEDTMIWALKSCLLEPLSYFDFLDLSYEDGKCGPELKSVKFNCLGRNYFLKSLSILMFSIMGPLKEYIGGDINLN